MYIFFKKMRRRIGWTTCNNGWARALLLTFLLPFVWIRCFSSINSWSWAESSPLIFSCRTGPNTFGVRRPGFATIAKSTLKSRLLSAHKLKLTNTQLGKGSSQVLGRRTTTRRRKRRRKRMRRMMMMNLFASCSSFGPQKRYRHGASLFSRVKCPTHTFPRPLAMKKVAMECPHLFH